MKKTICIGIIIILMIIVIYVFATPSNKKENNTVNDETQKIEESNENEQVNEVVTNELSNEITNDVVSNEIENTVSSETFEESPKTAEEKAVDIAKKDWGEDSGANFSVEGMDGNGNYIVAVRNSDTVALAFYTVDVANGTFTKREMN